MHTSRGGWSFAFLPDRYYRRKYQSGLLHCHSKTRSGFQKPNPVGTIPYFLFITPVGTILDRWNFTRPGLSSFVKIAPTGFLSCASRHAFTFLHAAVTTLTMLNQLQRCAGYTLPHSTFPELALFRIFACIQHQIPVGFFASLAGTDRYYLPFFFYPDRVINTPIMTKNIQNAILSQPKKQ